ncbi:nucleotide exchange factor GrpE [Kaarinaea lacus]
MVTDENAVSDPAEQAGSDTNTSPDAKTAADSGSDTTAKPDTGDETVKEELAKLQEQLTQAEEKASKHWDELLRAKADLENTRRRLQRDVENAHKYAVEKFIQDLLPVIDSLEMGINAAKEVDADIHKVKEGNELTLKMFNDCANKFGVEAIDPKGKPFNPEYHQAMSMQESSEQEPNTVLAVMQKGYLLNGRLVRPAMVIVAKAVEKDTEHGAQKEEQKDTNTDKKT